MNLNGDYISDALAAQVGGIGIAPGANINYVTGHAIFEATHGTAPKYAGLDKVNPSSVLLSGVLLLEHLGWNEAAKLVTASVEKTIASKVVTYDFARLMEGATEVKCSEFANELIKNMDVAIIKTHSKAGVNYDNQTQESFSHRCRIYRSNNSILISTKELADVVLVDIPQLENPTKGKALDMLEASPVQGFDANIIGTSDYADTADSDVVVITAGIARKPGMSRDDLVATNSKIMKSITRDIAKHSPNAIIVVLTNPVDAMTYSVFKEAGFPKERVIGQSGVLDTARFRTFIAQN